MLLLIDIGNQHTKWAWAISPKLLRLAATTPTPTIPSALPKILPQAPAPISAIVVASVVPAATNLLRSSLNSWAASVPLYTLDYTSFRRVMPTEVKPTIEPGADRLANALALRELHKLPACSLDAGSALTLEVVDARGCFISGAIAPGAALQLAALQQGTSQLARITQLPAKTPRRGATTADAMAIGIRVGLAGAACALIHHAASLLKQPPATIVLSGGDAPLLLPALKQSFPSVKHDPLLPLRGLACFYTLLNPTH